MVVTGSAELPQTDPWLGIHDSRYLYDSLARETARARHSGRSVSLIIAGLDELQQIIETHGQDAGAALLQHAINLTRSALRQGDWIARHEEGEFAIVLPETHLDGAYSAAERMRRRCTENPFALPASQLVVTASFGVACIDMNAACAEEATILLQDARNALRESKRIGRNRVTCGPARAARTPTAWQSSGS